MRASKVLNKMLYLQGTPSLTAAPAVSIATSSSVLWGQSRLTSNHKCMESFYAVVLVFTLLVWKRQIEIRVMRM